MKFRLLILFCFFLTGCTFWSSPKVPTPWSQIRLLDQSGQKKTIADFSKTHVFVNFIFTRCPVPDMCPLTMNLSKRLLVSWKKERSTTPLKILNITVDPDYDRPEVLMKFGKDHGVNFDEFIFLTGTEKDLTEVASEFNVIGIPGGGGLIAHNIKSVLLGPGLKEIAQFKDNEWTPKDVLQSLNKVSD